MSLDGFNKKDLLRKIKDSNLYADLSDISKSNLEKVILSNHQTVGDLVRAVS
jgi:hypothetical protein